MAVQQQSDFLEKLLLEVGLPHLMEKFKQERVDFSILAAASDDDLKKLGVKCLGDRIRVRSYCRNHNKLTAATTSSSALTNSFLSLNAEPNSGSFCSPQEERNVLFTSRRRGGARSASGQTITNKKQKVLTWTGKFICLADNCAEKVPTPTEKQVLENAGLGYRKIVFNVEDKEEKVYRALTSSDKDGDESGLTVGYPKLKGCGGFELLRCVPNCKLLEPISGCMDVENLKRSVGQGKLYIRPIQNSLSILPLKDSARNSTSSLKEKCVSCNQLFSVSILRDYVESCTDTLHSGSNVIDDLDLIDSNDDFELPKVLSNFIEQPPTPEEAESLQDKEDEYANSAFHIEYVPRAMLPNFNENRLNDFDIDVIVSNFIRDSKEILNPVELLRKMQGTFVTGRALEVSDPESTLEGETNYIMIDQQSSKDGL